MNDISLLSRSEHQPSCAMAPMGRWDGTLGIGLLCTSRASLYDLVNATAEIIAPPCIEWFCAAKASNAAEAGIIAESHGKAKNL